MNTTKQLGGALGLAGLVALTAPLLAGNAVVAGATVAFAVMAFALLVVAGMAVLLPADASTVATGSP